MALPRPGPVSRCCQCLPAVPREVVEDLLWHALHVPMPPASDEHSWAMVIVEGRERLVVLFCARQGHPEAPFDCCRAGQNLALAAHARLGLQPRAGGAVWQQFLEPAQRVRIRSGKALPARMQSLP